MGALLILAGLGLLVLAYGVGSMVLLDRMASSPAADELQQARLEGRVPWPYTTAA